MNTRKRKGTYWAGQRALGTVEVFWTDVPIRDVGRVHANDYKAVVGPFSSRAWADRAANAPWKVEEILKEYRAAIKKRRT